MALAWIHAELTSLFCQQKKHVSTVTLVTEHELLSLLEVAVLCSPYSSRLRSIQAVFSCNWIRCVNKSAVASSFVRPQPEEIRTELF